ENEIEATPLSIFFIGIISKWPNNILSTRESFTIDRESKSFLKDGHPFRYISGTIHYFRVLPDSWRDRMRKLRHAGCNVLQTYVEWASHEPEPGEYNFKGRFNLFQYLNIAHEEGLLVILRPGPYIDAERDMGGLPYWLLRENPSVRLRTMDNSRNVTECFSAQRLFEPNGPLVNSEFYPGWLDHWGAPHSKRSSKYVKLPPGPVPGPSPKYAYGDVQVHPKAELLSLSSLLKSVTSTWPLTFEELSVFSGLVVYSTKIPKMISDPARLSLYDIHDRGYVYVDNQFVGIVSREQELYVLPISAKPNQDLVIVVESQGRICYGDNINDFKGITTNVTIGETHKISNWEMTPVPLTNSTELRMNIEYLQQKTLNQVRNSNSGGMTFYEGKFNVPKESGSPKDTFLRLDGWTKGYAWINDFLLGRYWPAVGPQVTLYIPSGLLHFDDNKILLLELEKAPCNENSSCNVSFVDIPEVNGPTPEW
ncbi:Beta-galactosidase, partial [Armadillidium nasatum]